MIMQDQSCPRVREMMLCLANQGYSSVYWFSDPLSVCFQLADILVCEDILQSELDVLVALSESEEKQ